MLEEPAVQTIEESADEVHQRQIAEQDVSIEAGIGQASILIKALKNDARMMEALAAVGYDEVVMEEGLSLVSAARMAFGSRSSAIARRREASAALAGAESSAKKSFTDFRIAARALFPDDAVARSALHLMDEIPGIRGQFIARAHTALDNARQEPYAVRMAQFGFDEEALQHIQDTITALEDADASQNQAISDAMTATQERDQAWDELSSWISQLKGMAKSTLRDQPDLMKVLEV